MIKIYHNPRCKKSRASLKYLTEKDVEFKVIKYLTDQINENELTEILNKLGYSPFELTRTQEVLYKATLKDKNFTDEEWIRILVSNPKLIKRPIVVFGSKAILADPAEKIDELL